MAKVQTVGARTRLDGLTGLRWVAALAVFGFHLSLVVTPHRHVRGVMDAVFGSGYTGVSLFFILSGLVLTWSHRVGDTRPAFYRRRFARIWPSYAASWAAMFTLGALFGYVSLKPGPALAAFLAVQSWVPRSTWVLAVNPALWTVACEALFYLLFPFLLRALGGLTLTGRRWIIAGLVGSVVAWPVLVHDALGTSFTSAWIVNYFPAARLPEFVIGILLAMELRDRTCPRVGVAPAAVLAACAYGLAWHVPAPYSYVSVTVLPYALLITAVAQRDIGGRASTLHHPLLVYLGERSYAFYLVHIPVTYLVLGHLKVARLSTSTLLLIYGVDFVASLLAAGLVHGYLEQPAERRLRGSQPPRLTAMPLATPSPG